jgi:hypothetical protein
MPAFLHSSFEMMQCGLDFLQGGLSESEFEGGQFPALFKGNPERPESGKVGIW